MAPIESEIFRLSPSHGPTYIQVAEACLVAAQYSIFVNFKADLTSSIGPLQRLPVDLNQDGFRGSGEALWH
jgi:hypothetical protein